MNLKMSLSGYLTINSKNDNFKKETIKSNEIGKRFLIPLLYNIYIFYTLISKLFYDYIVLNI